MLFVVAQLCLVARLDEAWDAILEFHFDRAPEVFRQLVLEIVEQFLQVVHVVIGNLIDCVFHNSVSAFSHTRPRVGVLIVFSLQGLLPTEVTNA